MKIASNKKLTNQTNLFKHVNMLFWYLHMSANNFESLIVLVLLTLKGKFPQTTIVDSVEQKAILQTHQ